jgi:GPH family glycoside/pentoside/hexuronide:cation symporter
MIAGSIGSLLFPAIVLPLVGVDQGRWITAMSIVSICAIPASILIYYFTRERVTEETFESKEETQPHSLTEQLRACLSSKYWLIVMGVYIIYGIQSYFGTTTLVYFANWIIGKYNDGVTIPIISSVGQLPLGFGVFILWPLVKKLGKQKVWIAGMLLSVVGCIICMLSPRNLPIVLAGMMIYAFGRLPTYTLNSIFADALDHVEWKTGFRPDGLSASIWTIIMTVSMGVATGLFNMGLGITGYTAPLADGTIIPQSQAVQSYIIFSMFGVPAIGLGLIGILMLFFKVEKQLPQIRAAITARHKAEAEARGEVYVSLEEKAAQEQARLDQIAEEKRVEELRAKCAKKGVSFDEEEAKYQSKLAAKKAKAEAKTAKKGKTK